MDILCAFCLKADDSCNCKDDIFLYVIFLIFLLYIYIYE